MQAVEQLESLLTDQPKNPLRPAQMQDYEEELARLETHANAPAYVGGDRGVSRKRANHLRRMLVEQAPKKIDEPVRQNAVHKLCQTVLNEVIRPSMLTREQMRRNPAGAVDHFLRRENSKPIKRAILTWKRGMWALDPHTDERDLTNLEKFRPEGNYGPGTSSFMADAQIPGVFGMSPAAKANWPLGEPTVETPLKHAVAQEPSKPAEKASEVSAHERRVAAGKKAAAARWARQRLAEQAQRITEG